MLLSTEPQPCPRVGLAIAQRGLANFHLEDLVLSPKAEPDPFSSPLPKPLGEEGSAILASPGSRRLRNPFQAPGEGQALLCSRRSAGCGEDGRARGPVLGLDSLPAGWREGRGGCLLASSGELPGWTASPRNPPPASRTSEPLSPHSALAPLLPHSHSLRAISSPHGSNDP